MQTAHQVARAKINLTLHVGRVIADPSDPSFGYHPLDSLVVFADIGDRLTAVPAEQTSLTIDGPFAQGLETDETNLILKAYASVIQRVDISPLAFTLTKNLPIASGIGGGSADAAAALRLMRAYVDKAGEIWADQDWKNIALNLGADVPVCLSSQTAHMTGIGEDISVWPDLGQIHAVLVNPGQAVSTAAIFKAFDAGDVRETPRPQLATGDLLARSRDGRNDLQLPAIAECAIIKDVIDALSSQAGCQLARMSGSGATCFGLFTDGPSAQDAVNAVQQAQPDWWLAPTLLGEAR